MDERLESDVNLTFESDSWHRYRILPGLRRGDARFVPNAASAGLLDKDVRKRCSSSRRPDAQAKVGTAGGEFRLLLGMRGGSTPEGNRRLFRSVRRVMFL